MISELQKRKLFQVLDLLAEIGRMHLAERASQMQETRVSLGDSDGEVITSGEIILVAEE